MNLVAGFWLATSRQCHRVRRLVTNSLDSIFAAFGLTRTVSYPPVWTGLFGLQPKTNPVFDGPLLDTSPTAEWNSQQRVTWKPSSSINPIDRFPPRKALKFNLRVSADFDTICLDKTRFRRRSFN